MTATRRVYPLTRATRRGWIAGNVAKLGTCLLLIRGSKVRVLVRPPIRSGILTGKSASEHPHVLAGVTCGVTVQRLVRQQASSVTTPPVSDEVKVLARLGQHRQCGHLSTCSVRPLPTTPARIFISLYAKMLRIFAMIVFASRCNCLSEPTNGLSLGPSPTFVDRWRSS
jgi:hypothetical protein